MDGRMNGEKNYLIIMTIHVHRSSTTWYRTRTCATHIDRHNTWSMIWTTDKVEGRKVIDNDIVMLALQLKLRDGGNTAINGWWNLLSEQTDWPQDYERPQTSSLAWSCPAHACHAGLVDWSVGIMVAGCYRDLHGRLWHGTRTGWWYDDVNRESADRAMNGAWLTIKLW